MLNRPFYLPRPDRFWRLFLSRFRRPDIDLTAVEQVLAEYGLALVKSPHVPGGRGRSRSLIVHTTQGKKVLKRYVPTRTLPTIVHEHSILKQLAEVDFPAPRLAVTRAGETIVSQGDRHYALFNFIEGGFQYHDYLLLPAQSRRFLVIAGETLAALHLQLADFVPEGQNPFGFKSPAEGEWRDLDWYLNRLAHCVQETQRFKSTASTPQADQLLQQSSSMERTLVELDRTLKQADLPRLIIHSDYGPYNLLFRPHAPMTVLDFELARVDWRLSEFVYAFPHFAHYKWFGFNFGKAQCLLDAYRMHLPIKSDELRFLPAVWQFLKIRQAIVGWHSYCETRATLRLVQAAEYMTWVKWVTEHQVELVDRLIAD